MPRIMFLRSMAMDDPNGCLPAQNPSHRRIQAGDVIITEFSASLLGLHGPDPAPDLRRGRADRAVAAHVRRRPRRRTTAIMEVLMPGATEADTIRAGSVIGEAGYAIYDDLVHGYGVGIEPPDRRPLLRPVVAVGRRQPGARGPKTFEEGMAVVVQPNPITPDERMGLQLGQLGVIRANGIEHAPHGPVRATGGRRLSAVGLALIGTGMWAGHVAKAAARTPSVRARQLLQPRRRPAGGVRRRGRLRGGVLFEAAIDDPTVEAVAPRHAQLHARRAGGSVRGAREARVRREADRRHARGRPRDPRCLRGRRGRAPRRPRPPPARAPRARRSG